VCPARGIDAQFTALQSEAVPMNVLSFLWRRKRGEGAAAAFYHPYADGTANRLYNLLFCDNAELFRDHSAAAAGALRVLVSKSTSAASLRAIVDAAGADSRLRALAAQRLLQSGQRSGSRFVSFGVLLEVPLPDGLEVLATYADGAVRYLDRSGRATVYDHGPPEVRELAAEAVDHAQARALRLPPWSGARLPPPRVGDVRVSVLGSDGLRFVQGPFASLQKDPDTAALVSSAARLLRRLGGPATSGLGG
jgi:hypothetical protein